MRQPQIKKKRKKASRMYAAIWCILIFIVLCLTGIHRLEKALPGISIKQNRLNSSHMVLMEVDSGKVLDEKDGDKKIYPASLTKVMTALVALEDTESLDTKVTVPSDIFPALYKENASMAGFLPGEEVTLRDLLYGILLPSGAECCLAYAEYAAGSEEAFVNRMNEKAEELGMRHTCFVNTTGLHDEEHVTTAEDIAVLFRYALENEDFRTVISSRRYSVAPTNKHTQGFTFYSTLFQSLENLDAGNVEILGGKTGYTPQAGLCLVSYTKINGIEYILVTAEAKGTHQTEPFHVLDALNIYGQIYK